MMAMKSRSACSAGKFDRIGPATVLFRRVILVVAWSIGLGACSHPQPRDVRVETGTPSKTLRPDEVARRTVGAVGVITTDAGRGMGFVIDPSGYFLTNRHVIENSNHISSVVFPGLDPSLTFRSVDIVYIDPLRDLALLKIHGSKALPFLPLATGSGGPMSAYIAQKDSVLLLSRDYAAEAKVPKGGAQFLGLVAYLGEIRRVEVYNPAAGPGTFFSVTMNVQKGQSGGPVVDRFGRAVGIVTWTRKDRTGGFAVPIGEVNRMIEERPNLDTETAHIVRVRQRVEQFVAAVDLGDPDRIRSMTSPSLARARRESIVPLLLERAMVATPVLQKYLESLDEAIVEAQQSDTSPFPRFNGITMALGRPEFVRGLGVQGVSNATVLAFFFEFGQAYLAARYHGELGSKRAVEVALERVHSLEAARNFVRAETMSVFENGVFEVEAVKIVRGQFAPRALVTVGRRAGSEKTKYAFQMRLEWGDWYLGEVQKIGAN